MKKVKKILCFRENLNRSRGVRKSSEFEKSKVDVLSRAADSHDDCLDRPT